MSITFPVPHFPHYHAEVFDGAGTLYAAILASGGGRHGCIVYSIASANAKPIEVLAPGAQAYSAPQLVIDSAGVGHLFSMDEATVLHSWPIPGWVPLRRSLPLSLVPPWYPFGEPFAAPALHRDGKTVHLSGVVKGGNVGLALAVLPTGWRPASQLDLAVESGGVVNGADWTSMPGRIDIAPDGKISQVSGGNRWLSLCVSFAAT